METVLQDTSTSSGENVDAANLDLIKNLKAVIVNINATME